MKYSIPRVGGDNGGTKLTFYGCGEFQVDHEYLLVISPEKFVRPTSKCYANLFLIQREIPDRFCTSKTFVNLKSILMMFWKKYSWMFLVCLWKDVRLFLGFAADLLNFGPGSEHKGNLVKLISSTRSYICDVHKEGCTERQIECYTRWPGISQ